MSSVFGSVFRLSGGENVWANVFVLDEVEIGNPSQAGWIARPANRVSVTSGNNRISICSTNQRLWIARQGNE